MIFIKMLLEKSWFRYSLVAISSALLASLATTFLYPEESIREESRKEVRSALQTEHSKAIQEITLSNEEKIKSIVQKHEAESVTASNINTELSKKIDTLTSENTQLKSKRRVETVIVKDATGKEETKIIDTTETESSSSKTQQIISELNEKHKKEIIEIEKKFSEQKELEKSASSIVASKDSKENESIKSSSESKETNTKITQSNSKKLGLGLGFTSDKLYSVESSYQIIGPFYGQIVVNTDFTKTVRGGLSLGLRL